MAETEITIEDLRAMTRSTGIEMSDQRLKELLPHMEAVANATHILAELDLGDVPPPGTHWLEQS